MKCDLEIWITSLSLVPWEYQKNINAVSAESCNCSYRLEFFIILSCLWLSWAKFCVFAWSGLFSDCLTVLLVLVWGWEGRSWENFHHKNKYIWNCLCLLWSRNRSWAGWEGRGSSKQLKHPRGRTAWWDGTERVSWWILCPVRLRTWGTVPRGKHCAMVMTESRKGVGSCSGRQISVSR